MTSTAAKVKEASSNLVKFSAGGLGFGVGLAGMSALNKLTASLPPWIPTILKKMAPGVAVMFLSYWLSTKAKDDRLEAALLGVGFSGGADSLRRLIGPMLPSVKTVVPGLDGTQGSASVNVGDTPPSYYEKNAFQGISMQGMSMQGPGSYALNGAGAYALNGRRRGLRGALPAYAMN